MISEIMPTLLGLWSCLIRMYQSAGDRRMILPGSSKAT
jgi:hypothetical protein